MVMPYGPINSIIIILLSILSVITVGTLAIFILYLVARGCLTSWATEQNYRVLTCKYRFFHAGPFTSLWDNIGFRQPVFFIKIQDSRGNFRTGWARCHIAWIDKTGARLMSFGRMNAQAERDACLPGEEKECALNAIRICQHYMLSDEMAAYLLKTVGVYLVRRHGAALGSQRPTNSRCLCSRLDCTKDCPPKSPSPI